MSAVQLVFLEKMAPAQIDISVANCGFLAYQYVQAVFSLGSIAILGQS